MSEFIETQHYVWTRFFDDEGRPTHRGKLYQLPEEMTRLCRPEWDGTDCEDNGDHVPDCPLWDGLL